MPKLIFAKKTLVKVETEDHYRYYFLITAYPVNTEMRRNLRKGDKIESASPIRI